MDSRIQISNSRSLYDNYDNLGEPIIDDNDWKGDYDQSVYLDGTLNKDYTSFAETLNREGFMIISKSDYKYYKSESEAFKRACSSVSNSRMWIGGTIIGLFVTLYDIIFNDTNILAYCFIGYSIAFLTAIWIDSGNFGDKMKNPKPTKK